MADISQLSDDELLAAIQVAQSSGAPAVSAPADINALSDQQLLQAINVRRDEEDPGFLADVGAAAALAIPQAGLAAQQLVTNIAGLGASPQQGAQVAQEFQQALNQETQRIFNETGDFESAFNQAKQNVIEAGFQDPGRVTLEDVRRSQAAVAGRLAGTQEEIGARSPVAQAIGEIGTKALIAAPLAAGAGLVGGSAILGGADPLLTPRADMRETAGEALLGEAGQATLGAVTGAGLGKGLQLGGRAIQNATPLVAKRVGDAARALDAKAGNVIADSFNKIAKINPAAAKDALDVGIASSVAQISDATTVKLVDRFLSRFPFAAETLKNNGLETIAKIEGQIAKLGGDKAVSTQEAGEVLKEGATRFVERFRDSSNRLYKSFDKEIPEGAKFRISNVDEFADSQLSRLSQAPSAREDLLNTSSFRLIQNMQDDAAVNGGALPFDLVKYYRTRVGNLLNDRHILGNADQGVLKGLYGALSKDMETAARQIGKAADDGSTIASRKLARANNFYSQGAKKIEDRLQKVINSNAPEDILSIMLSGTRRGGTRVNSIMKTLNNDEKEIVVGTVLKDLGKASPGQQSAAGDVFSVDTMLTNWNKISPEAKTALFGKSGSRMRKSLDQITQIVERLKDVNRFANPSGTAQAVTTGVVSAGLLLEPITTIGGVVAANMSAKLMTNPRFVGWLARNANQRRITKKGLENEIAKLAKIAEKNPEIAPEIQQYINAVGVNAANRGVQNGGNI